MKKLLYLAVLLPAFISCDFILKGSEGDTTEVKADKKVVLGQDKDAKGCVTSAGYRWSELRKECVRVFEEGYRLNPVEELAEDGSSKSAFVIFAPDSNRVELYLPDTSKSILLDKEGKAGSYKNLQWSLFLKENYTLTKDGRPVYAGAAIQEGKITGDSEEGS